MADSINEEGDRLTTLEVVFHRFVLAEMNTHRKFSRNSASSRAIPVQKQIRRVEMSPAMPVSWPAEQKGMQGGEELLDATMAQKAWRNAADDAVIAARRLTEEGVHKSVTNRVLEPFMMHTAVISATDWDGFWEQRCSPLAQPEIRVAAELMKEAYDGSIPRVLDEGDWHLPYVLDDEMANPMHVLGKVSAARCARTSYLTQDGKRDFDEDIALYQRLVSARPAHWSPLEHVATPDLENKQDFTISGYDFDGRRYTLSRIEPRYGNFRGWRQHRIEMESAA